METVTGKIIQEGFAVGPLRVWRRREAPPPAAAVLPPAQERARFEAARAQAGAQLEALCRRVRAELGEDFRALAYPGGYYNDLTEVLIHQAGIPITLSIRTDSRNVLVKGLPQSLYALCRWNVTADTTPESLLQMVGGQRG